MIKHARFGITAVVAMALVTVAAARAQEKPEALAQKAAESWLALVDAGKYAESWDHASPALKSQVTKAEWLEKVKAARGPLGKVQSRKLVAAKYAKDPPSAPPGEYVVIQFASSFKNLPSATETVAPMLDKDGRWRVSGYYVKKN